MKINSWRIALLFILLGVSLLPALIVAQEGGVKVEGETNESDFPTVEKGLKNEKVASKTDDEVVERSEESIQSGGFSVKELKTIREKAQTLQFQAEVNKLMGIIINSLYSSKEVFLREVISNASDALDKIRHIGLTDSSQIGENTKYEIRVKADEKARTLTITDTGVGMTKEDLVNHLGTIAKSGTTEFLKNLKDTSNSNLIGQFGVGFYSVYLVADNVTVISKNNNDVQQVWQSDAQSTFTISEDPRGNTLGRGTSLVLHIKKGEEQFLQPATLSNLLKKYSEFINFPIFLWTEKDEEVEVPLTEEELEEKKKERDEKKEKEGEAEGEEGEEEPLPTTKKVREKIPQWELMNENKPIWSKNPKEVTDEEYNTFFKIVAKDTAAADPLKHIHFTAEGDVEFKCLLYIPGVMPSNQYDTTGNSIGRNIKLYVKRVFITDDFRDILPKYLAFLRGLVDADDLPLNVSREQLQEHRNLQVIKNKIVRKILAVLQEMADEDKEKYSEFYKLFSANVKLGVIEDAKNRQKLGKLLRFQSSKSEGKLISFAEYTDRMREGQKEIYYISGDSVEAVSTSPLLERLVKKGYEVLYMTEPIDEYTVSSMDRVDGKYQLRNVVKGVLDLGEDKEESKKTETEFNTLTTWLKKELGSKVELVRTTNRLVNFPTALVSNLFGLSPQMEKIMKAQAMADPNSRQMPPKRNLEINPKHPLIVELNKRVTEDESNPRAKELAQVLYQTAVLSSGYSIDDPQALASQIVKMMNSNLELDPNATAPEEVIEELPVAEKEEKEDDGKKKKKKKLPPNVKLDNPDYADFINFGDSEDAEEDVVSPPEPEIVTPPQDATPPQEEVPTKDEL
eukprot:TRINITY_DN912_c0_g1_i1.p1 TRINITY_DN912_c0_g1~~TRINITY_DN912_c0_g1_i1.p1  ORF type:complete len:851 (-),score=359.68 TRINITY_DN912_c0_g1_i1:132-2684(-)